MTILLSFSGVAAIPRADRPRERVRRRRGAPACAGPAARAEALVGGERLRGALRGRRAADDLHLGAVEVGVPGGVEGVGHPEVLDLGLLDEDARRRAVDRRREVGADERHGGQRDHEAPPAPATCAGRARAGSPAGGARAPGRGVVAQKKLLGTTRMSSGSTGSSRPTLLAHLLLPVDPAHDADLALGGGVGEPAGERHGLEHVGVAVAGVGAGALDLARDVADLGAGRADDDDVAAAHRPLERPRPPRRRRAAAPAPPRRGSP